MRLTHFISLAFWLMKRKQKPTNIKQTKTLFFTRPQINYITVHFIHLNDPNNNQQNYISVKFFAMSVYILLKLRMHLQYLVFTK